MARRALSEMRLAGPVFFSFIGLKVFLRRDGEVGVSHAQKCVNGLPYGQSTYMCGGAPFFEINVFRVHFFACGQTPLRQILRNSV